MEVTAVARLVPDPLKILQNKFYTMLSFQAFWVATQIFQPLRMLKKFA